MHSDHSTIVGLPNLGITFASGPNSGNRGKFMIAPFWASIMIVSHAATASWG